MKLVDETEFDNYNIYHLFDSGRGLGFCSEMQKKLRTVADMKETFSIDNSIKRNNEILLWDDRYDAFCVFDGKELFMTRRIDMGKCEKIDNQFKDMFQSSDDISIREILEIIDL